MILNASWQRNSFEFSCSAMQLNHKFLPEPLKALPGLPLYCEKPTRKTHSCKSGKNTQFFKIFSSFLSFSGKKLFSFLSSYLSFYVCVLPSRSFFPLLRIEMEIGKKNYSCRKEFTRISPKAARIKKIIIFALRSTEKAFYVKCQ